MRYRRNFVPGGSFFFTAVTADRRPFLAAKDTVDVLRAAFRAVRARHPFALDAIVVLPDHVHCVWTLPPGDGDFALRWRLIKTWFSKHCDPSLRTSGARLWQQRYWEHTLQDEEDFARHVDYIHYNPVKHGYAPTVMEWPYSSFRRYVDAGVYPRGWGSGVVEFEGVGGE